MSNPQTDRNICKFFILGKCRRGDGCQWTHTTNQCQQKDCDVYTTHKLCFKCTKKEREAKKAAYEKKLNEEGYPCVNHYDPYTKKTGSCRGYTLNGDYCNECFEDAKQYILGPCRNRDCSRRVMGARGYCSNDCAKQHKKGK
uniref:C3H1-type domain-containing protein n=1 Tax=viral metagenome TaxID=1070528 RepID=A0A6C0EJJ3_9ZZZZ